MTHYPWVWSLCKKMMKMNGKTDNFFILTTENILFNRQSHSKHQTFKDTVKIMYYSYLTAD